MGYPHTTHRRPRGKPGSHQGADHVPCGRHQVGAHTVLEDITFDCRKGRITAILGPSGTGKSVLLKNILGLLRKKFGVLFQYGALFGSMISTTTSHSPLREHTRKNEAAIRELVHRNAELVGQMDHLKKLPGEVSGA